MRNPLFMKPRAVGAKAPGELKRVIGVSGLASGVVNLVVGAGIFVLPAIVGLQLGSFAFLGYLFCGLMLAAIMLCYAEIGSRVTESGGNYAYVKAAFGELPAYVVNWLFLIAWCILSDAALMNILADSLAVMHPVFLNYWVRALLFLAALGFMAGINILGAREGVNVVKVLTIIKLLPLFGIIILGFAHIRTNTFNWEHFPSAATFGNVMLVLFFAYCGFEAALGTSGEVKNPRRTVPNGILLGGLFVVVFYLLIQYVTQGVLGKDMETAKEAPLAAVAQKILGPVGGKILLLTAAISSFGTVFADVMNGPRLLFAGARDGLFPKFLGATHKKFATPYWAIGVYGLLILIASLGGGFQQLAVLASASILLTYLAVVLATVKLRYRKTVQFEKGFRMPGGLTFPIIAIITIFWLLSHLKKSEMLATLLFMGVVCVIYFVTKRMQTKRR